MSHDHAHSHSHPPSPSAASAAAIVETNKTFFNNLASHPSPHSHSHSHTQVASHIASSILSSPTLIPLSESSTRLLDYACGTGSVSRLLLPHVASLVGADVSSGAVGEFNFAARNQGLEEGEMRAVVADLVTGEGDVVAVGGEYDVALCSLALHHMPDPLAATKAIARVLKHGGVFVCVDFRQHEKIAEGWGDIVPHLGFGEGQVRSWFKEAGLGEPVFVPVGANGKGVTLVNRGLDGGELKVRREVFMAVGKKL
ncbi:S-adenosyl-L-methionine-dependent methyltransferase [Tricharina praecox]|uniref:S-adenosyl-L-methionine-dependent methyltransferase n=1 Tax=Tricharina praecox TaxID=43433 RepID=UPI0022202FB0|nr:S-adenosyl-L-methionine-dependent methyltransferase [Tricharina praecox]KAI5846151.1 S-adenosyl-L-methionine-dependent methyltransferase [Tricharina praecox]